MNSKHFLGSNKYNLDEIEAKERRENKAKYLISKIKKSRVSWFRREMLRNLYFYLDFNFVREELLEIYQNSNDDKLKKDIRGLHDGSIDVTDLIAMSEENQRLFDEAKEEVNTLPIDNTKLVSSDLLMYYKHNYNLNN